MAILKYNKLHVWRLNKYYRTEIKYGSIAKRYERIMEREASELDPYFTADSLNNMLEIGPGMGVFSALVYKKYAPKLHLIDGSGTDEKPEVDNTVGWRADNPTPCADIEAMNSFLYENDIANFDILELLPSGEFRLIKDDKPELDTVELEDVWPRVKFDLIVSLRSWCFHYDADLYLDFVVKRSIPHHTKLLVDIRREHGQPEKLAEHFKLIKEIETGSDTWKMARLFMEAK
jgi:hypothetical protein